MNIRWQGAPETEFSPQFVQGMADRMIFSYAKYGAVSTAYPKLVNAVESLLLRLLSYLGEERFDAVVARVKTQYPKPALFENTEALMDVGNFAMIEFMRPRYGTRYEPTDSKGSPGRMWVGEKNATDSSQRF